MRSARLIRRLAPSGAARTRTLLRHATRPLGLEALEQRRMMTLLGVTPGYPKIASDQTGTITYTYDPGSLTGSFDLSANPFTYQDSATSPQRRILGTPTFQIHFKTDPSGTVQSGVVGADFTITGAVDLNGNRQIDAGEPNGVLLQGEILDFGYSDLSSTTDLYDFRFEPTAGLLLSSYTGKDVGVSMNSEASTFNGDFTHNFTGKVKAEVGPIDKTITTPPSPVTLSGIKYQDLTGDGFSADDAPLAGVTINLFKDVDNDGVLTAADGGSIASVLTGVDGSYTFMDLPAGRYFVQEAADSAFIQTGGPAYYTANPTSGQAVTGLDFDNFKKITISGTKYNDLSGNSFSADDTPQAGVTINLYNASDLSTPVATTVTGADGSYAFADLGPGTYFVQEVLPSGSVQTGGNAGYTIVATSGTNAGGNDFDNFQLITISGTKFKDLTGNSFSADDTPLGGVTINLYTGDSSTPVASTVTAADGTYSFANVGPGTYFVQEVVPTGYSQTGGNAGYTIVASSGTNSTGNNFDNYLIPPPTGISGTKFRDLSGNGFSADDTGLGGVTIQLYKDKNNDGKLTTADGSVYLTTVTAADGTYSFTGLAAGTYFVKEVVPTGYIRTGPALTDTYTVTLAAGQVATGNDFDNYLMECDECGFSGIYYVIRSGCSVKTVTDLRGNTNPGDEVTAYFNYSKTDVRFMTLVTYTAPDAYFDANHASQQVIFDIDSQQLHQGLNSLTVQIPLCNYQIDFVCGLAIDKLGPANSNIFYTAQQRLISADNDGPGTGGLTCTSCTSSISGNIFDDCDGNGLFDGLNTGIGGVLVTLTGTPTGSRTSITLTRTTAPDGSYSFLGLPAGNYTITESQPSGYLDGVVKVGKINGSTKGTLGTNKISSISLGANQQGVDYNFTELKAASISGLVYSDKDNDGVVDKGESGIANVKITLTGTDILGNTVSLTVYTDSSGRYTFSNLRPSNAAGYTLTETSTPSGYTDGKETLGTVNGVAAGTVGSDKFSGILISCGDEAEDYNFGETVKSTIPSTPTNCYPSYTPVTSPFCGFYYGW